MKIRLAAILCALLCTTAASAQVDTEPLAWSPQYRPLADGISTALVVIQEVEAGREAIQAWRAGDHSVAWQDACSVAITEVTVTSLKHWIPEMRPDGSNLASFPSGHSAALWSLVSPRHPTLTITFAVTGSLLRAGANKHHFWGPGKAKDIPIGMAIGALANLGCHAAIH